MKKPNKADLLIYKAFNRALEKNLLRIYLDTAKLNRPSSPVYNPWENLLPILLPILLGLFLIITVGTFFGLAFIIGMVLIYTYYFKKIIDRHLLERTKKYIAANYENCQNLWKHGGIVLATEINKKLGCISPDGDWKEFTVQNFAEFMVDKKEENQEKPDEKPATTDK